MKKVLVNYGGIMLFYLVIILGLFFLNMRVEYINKSSNNDFRNDVAFVEWYLSFYSFMLELILGCDRKWQLKMIMQLIQ